MFEIAGNPLWLYIIIGLIAGVLSGTLGVGSGALLIPALVIFLAVPQKSAQGITLAVMVPMAIVGAIRYKLNPEIEINMNIVAILAITGVIGTIIGTELVGRLPASLLRKLFAVFLILVAFRMLFVSSKKKKKVDQELNERIENYE